MERENNALKVMLNNKMRSAKMSSLPYPYDNASDDHVSNNAAFLEFNNCSDSPDNYCSHKHKFTLLTISLESIKLILKHMICETRTVADIGSIPRDKLKQFHKCPLKDDILLDSVYNLLYKLRITIIDTCTLLSAKKNNSNCVNQSSLTPISHNNTLLHTPKTRPLNVTLCPSCQELSQIVQEQNKLLSHYNRQPQLREMSLLSSRDEDEDLEDEKRKLFDKIDKSVELMKQLVSCNISENHLALSVSPKTTKKFIMSLPKTPKWLKEKITEH